MMKEKKMNDLHRIFTDTDVFLTFSSKNILSISFVYFLLSTVSKLQGICTPTAKEINTQEMQFLVSDSYPNPLADSHTNCSCSIEVDNCSSKLNIYTIHLELEK